MSSCRSCGAEILWATTPAGKKIPLDAEPAERPKHLYRLEALDDADPPGSRGGFLAWPAEAEPVHLSHFLTCPQANEWSGGKRPGS